jgi:hypothetical protein
MCGALPRRRYGGKVLIAVHGFGVLSVVVLSGTFGVAETEAVVWLSPRTSEGRSLEG